MIAAQQCVRKQPMDASACLPEYLRPSSGDLVASHNLSSRPSKVSAVAVEQVLLSRYSLEEDIVVGSMHPNRSDPGLQAVLGCLTHAFAMRTDLSGALLCLIQAAAAP